MAMILLFAGGKLGCRAGGPMAEYLTIDLFMIHPLLIQPLPRRQRYCGAPINQGMGEIRCRADDRSRLPGVRWWRTSAH
ncbi:MAG TPA: hypothetical protein VFV18_08510 [Porticoccaceae bacterium]|nr:hypothetical protein [Porticoccaceae bacterium]